MMDERERETETVVAPESPGHLVSELLADVGLLLRQELDLARSELAEKSRRAKAGAVKAGIAVGAGLAGAVVLSAALVLALTLILSTWLPPLTSAFVSALAVGAILAIAAYVLFDRGFREMRAQEFVPRRTLESVKENAQWANKQLH